MRPLIEGAAPAIERDRALPQELRAALHDAGLFRLLLPRSYGGEEVEPATFVAAVEEIAKADASTAWCVAQGSGCSLAAAYLEPDVAREIFGGREAVLAWGPVGQAPRPSRSMAATASAAPGPTPAASATRSGSAGIARWSMRRARPASAGRQADGTHAAVAEVKGDGAATSGA